MLLAYDYITSRSFWRLVYPADRAPNYSAPTPPLSAFAYNYCDVEKLVSDWATPTLLNLDDGRVHVLVFDRNHRRTSHFHEAHAWTSDVPDGSLLDLGTGAFVSSPSFTFLQTAAMHSLVDTVAYGMELCGSFSFDPLSDRGMRKRVPLVTLGQLRAYLSHARTCSGYKQACKALDYIVEGAASPMEATDEMLLCLPYRYGGYGVPKPEMNELIELDESAVRIAKRSVCFADLCWMEQKLDVEHHGKHDHDDESGFLSDRARTMALENMGFEVIEITNEQVRDIEVFESTAIRIANKLGKRIRPDKLGATPERVALRQVLFSWNRAGGRRS